MSDTKTSGTDGKTFSWKRVILVSGAYTSYHIGSGFASGQEVMQFFGSWGWYWPLIVPLITAAVGILCTSISYRGGWVFQFEKPSDAYDRYFGKYLARFMDIFTMIVIAAIGLVMFAGSGAALHYYLGTPVYIGAIFMGIISVAVVWLGLEKVTDVLGVSGVIMVAIILIAGLYSLFTADTGIIESQKNLAQHVAEGKIMQAGIWGISNPVAAGVFYSGLMMLNSFPFMIAIGKGLKSNKEAVACGLGSSILFCLGVIFVVWAIIPNLDHIVESGSHLPMLAVVAKILPFLTPLFILVIIAGIFTTITGYLWIIGRRFAEDRTRKQKVIVAVVALVGIFAGSIIPFATLINILYPYSGIMGIFVLFVVLGNEIAGRVKVGLPRRPPANAATESTV